MEKNLIEYLESMEKGDIVIVEYHPDSKSDRVIWEFILQSLATRGSVVVGDFYGVGDVSFRSYIRAIGGEEYGRIMELIKNIRIIKIMSGAATYGEVIEEINPSYTASSFLLSYHSIINKLLSSAKPEYLLTFGVAQYVRFGGMNALEGLVSATGAIPIEDWTTIHFINVDALKKEELAVVEDMASKIVEITKERITGKKL